MRKSVIVGCCLLAASCFLSAQQKKYLDHLSDYIENTSVFGWNQEEGRAYHIPEKHISLNGDWKFFFSDTPEGIPSDFYKENFNDKAWSLIPVPSNWEMQGYGDKLFRNVHAPFKANPPFVPKEYNPTGAYRKTFTLPASWENDQVFLRLEKVASASFVWVNGQAIGYNEGAQEPAEYNITKYLKPGKNTVAIHVLKYSDGYYLEGQDYWRLAGIFDDVWLYATPSVRLFDWYVVTDLDDTYTDADLKLQVDIKKYTEEVSIDYRLKVQLWDDRKELVTELNSDPFKIESIGKKRLDLSRLIKNPKKWTSETPYLYTLKMSLLTMDGAEHDAIETRMGFKETEIRGEAFYLNGVLLKVNAQNSHMQHPEMGHAMTEDIIRKDFEILKQFNFNAVRTSHYPPVNKYLELADEYGLFVIDEAGVEAHATEFVSKKPEFTEMYKERVRQMVLRDRNHPSILFWSAGNESGEGFNIGEVVKEGRKYDYTRYWMYGGNAFAHPAEEIIGPRYPTPIELEMQVGICPDSSDIRPSFMDEYLSVAGNGWIEVWNRSHFLNSSYYRTKWFLEADGTVLDEGELDLRVAPLSKAKVQIPFKKPVIQAGAEYRITFSSTLRNKECWAPAGFEVAWDQLELPWHREKEVETVSISPVSLEQEKGQILISGTDFKYVFDKKQGTLISMIYKNSEMLKEPLKMNVWRAPLANEQDQWNSRNARSYSWKEGYGQQIAAEYYSTGIDKLNHYPISVDAQLIEGKALIRVREICLTGNSAVEKKDLYIWGAQSNGFENMYTYMIAGDGQIVLQHTLLPQGKLPLWLPRVGMTLTLDERLNQVEWYGRGPQENYPDRKTGYKIGIYRSTVDDMYEPYLIPQDYGLRTDNRWVRMTDEQGLGLEFSMNKFFNFNAYPYSTDNLTKAMYTYQLQKQDGITFNLDYATTGVGCTARAVFDSYKVYPGAYEREIRIKPIDLRKQSH